MGGGGVRSDLRQRAPAWFWIVAVLITVWGAIGVFAFYWDVTLSEAALAAMSDYDRALHASRPDWFPLVYGAATWGGLLGGVALLARRAIAWLPFAVSLVAVVFQFGYIFAVTDLIAVKGAAATVPFPVAIAVIAAFQLWFTGRATRRGWLR